MATYTIKAGDTLGGLAKQYNTTVADLAKTNNISNPNLIIAGQTLNLPGASPSPAVNVSPTVNAADLGQTKDLNLPPTPNPTVPNIATIPVDEQAQNFATSVMPAAAPTEAERTNTTLQQRILDIADKITGKSKRQAELQTENQVPEYQKQLTELNTQIKTLQNEANAQTIALQGQGRGITTGLLDRQAQGIERQRAIKALQLNSLAQAVQGSLALAQDSADRALQAEFGPMEDQLNYFKTALEMNQNNLSREDKKRAEALGIQLQERERLLAEQKENKKQILDVAQAAAQNGADALTLNKIVQSPDVQTAMSLGGNFLGAEFRMKQEQQQFENNLKTQQLAIDKMKALKNNNNSSSGISDVTQAVIDNPSLLSNLTPTVKGQVIAELQANGYDTSNLGTKPLSDGAIQKISETQSALDLLQELKTTIAGKVDQLGPLTGLEAYNPWSDKRKLQANVDLVRQKVGKALEGGVLRKEDEDKYKKILATLTDTPETATYKVDALIGTIQKDIENYTSLQQSAGRSTDVKSSLTKKGSTTQINPADLRNKYNY